VKVLDTLRSTMRFRRIELDANKRRLNKVASVDDLRRIARRRLPRGVFDYIDGGAEDERTLANNSAAFARIEFRPRVLREVGDIDPSTTLLGQPLPYPLVLAPTGYTRVADPEGELAVARAAARAQLPYSLSTMATRSIEDVAAVSNGRKWFQVYTFRDRGLVKDMISRAAEAGYEAIMPTVDLAVLGQRDRDVRRGFTMPPKLGVGTLLDGAIHPGWTWAFARSEPIRFANVAHHGVSTGSTGSSAPASMAAYANMKFDPNLSWRDIEWMRSIWDGPMIIKGIQCVEDAVLAAEHGVDAIALSNHGGRQLDSAPAPLDLLPDVAEAVGGRTEIICDGGVRRGSDIVKALALGATACMAGRAYLYGLGAAGEAGVDHVLDILASDMRRTMALIGCPTVKELDQEYVDRGGDSPRL
jgi:L-lactate dehydrogenase (cytochrome)